MGTPRKVSAAAGDGSPVGASVEVPFVALIAGLLCMMNEKV